jgi:ComEC/Rec2-related protein
MNWRLWELNPLLLYAVAHVLGLYFVFLSPWALAIFLVLCMTAYRRLFILTLFFMLAIPSAQHSQRPSQGCAYIRSQDKKNPSLYRGTLGPKQVYFYYSQPLIMHQEYCVQGVWEHPHTFYIHSLSLNKGISLTNSSRILRQKMQDFFSKNYPDAPSQALLMGLLTGQVNCPLLKKQFQLLGISHLLAISGFHFALIYYLLSQIFFRIRHPLFKNSLVFMLLTLYFLLLPHSPSCFRAWLFFSFHLLTKVLARPCQPLNTLGAALGCNIVLFPQDCLYLSFQLSYAATVGLLLSLPVTVNLFSIIWPPQGLYQQRLLSALKLCVYKFEQSLKLSLCLSLSTLWPTFFPLMGTFHCFYLHQFFYNLIIPPLIPLCLLTAPIPWIGRFVTHAVLHLIFHPPLLLPPFILPLRTDLAGGLGALTILCGFFLMNLKLEGRIKSPLLRLKF